MKLHSDSKTLIVGAGGGGIASALLAALRGEDVTLLEAHYALGGCASYFKRGQFVFDAGATTLSGVGIGEPLGDLFELLGHAPALYPADPGITFHLSNGKVVRYHRDFELWLKELGHHFPGKNHRTFWTLIRKINKKSWSLLRDVKTFPFTHAGDVLSVIQHPTYITLIPHLMISTEHALKKHGLDTPEYLELVNGILLISAQAESQHIPFLVGAMALSYPAETFAPVGGMKGLMDFFENELKRLNVDVRLKSRVSKVSGKNVILVDGTKFQTDKLIMNLPIWNLAEMMEGPIKNKLSIEAVNRPGSWGALALYFGIEADIRETYHQVHLNDPEIKNYFVSFSVPHDLKRAPAGYQTVTISTHVDAQINYDVKKNELAAIIMNDFKKRFNVNNVKFFTIGTPKTFERYTGRKNGFVGGLPFLYGTNPLTMLGPLTGEEGIYRVGDTVFPGQGLCGVVAGALQLHDRISKSEPSHPAGG